MTSTDKRGVLATLGVGAAMLVCCAAPVLLAASTLGALGGILTSPWLQAAGSALLLAALITTVARVRGHSRSTDDAPEASDNCCLPPHRDRRQRVPTPPNHQE